MVDLKDIQKQERKTVMMSIRTLPSYSNWLKKNKISPTKLFNKTVEELMKKESNNIIERR